MYKVTYQFHSIHEPRSFERKSKTRKMSYDRVNTAHVNSAGRFWPDPRRHRTKIATTRGNRPALIGVQCHCWSSSIPSGPKPRHTARATWKNQRMSILLCLHLWIIG